MALSYGIFITLFPIILAISHITLAYMPHIHGQDMITLVWVMGFMIHAVLNAIVALVVKLERYEWGMTCGAWIISFGCL